MNELLNMSVGQTELHPAIRAALHQPLPTPAYFDEYRRVQAVATTLLGQVMETNEPVHILLGLARTGLETGVYHLIAEGDRVLSVDTGHWGRFFGELVAGAGGRVDHLEAPQGEAVDLEELEQALRAGDAVSAITVAHCETNTGVVNPIDEIARLRDALSPETLLLVDGVSAFGGIPVRFDELGLDFYCGGSQKCLNAPQGTPVVCFSARARSAAERRALPLKTFALENKPSYLLVRGLEAVAKALFEEGLSSVYRRHECAAAAVRSGLRAMGLEVMARREEIASPTCTRIVFPPEFAGLVEEDRRRGGIDSDRVTRTMMNECGVVIGEDRIGTMGHFAQRSYVLAALNALEKTMELLGWRTADGSGVGAAEASFAGTEPA